MTTFASILWAAVAALCAVGFGVVTGIFHPEEKVNGLTVVKMLFKGLTNKEIAQRLGISEQTVRRHIQRLLRKTRPQRARDCWRDSFLKVRRESVSVISIVVASFS